MWDISSLTRDHTGTRPPFPAMEDRGLITGLPGKSLAYLV